MRQLKTLLLLCSFCGGVLAMPDVPPPHSISPTLNGLNISTYVKKDRMKIVLFVINHEAFPVLCDAQYVSGPELQDTREKTISTGKAEDFKFNYGRRGNEVVLRLICVDPQSNKSTTETLDEKP